MQLLNIIGFKQTVNLYIAIKDICKKVWAVKRKSTNGN